MFGSITEFDAFMDCYTSEKEGKIFYEKIKEYCKNKNSNPNIYKALNRESSENYAEINEFIKKRVKLHIYVLNFDIMMAYSPLIEDIVLNRENNTRLLIFTTPSKNESSSAQSIVLRNEIPDFCKKYHISVFTDVNDFLKSIYDEIFNKPITRSYYQEK